MKSLKLALLAALLLQSNGGTNDGVRQGVTMKDHGAVSLGTSGQAAAITSGYAELAPQNSSEIPSGIAILSLRQNDILIGDTVETATRPIRSGRIHAEISDSVNTGL